MKVTEKKKESCQMALTVEMDKPEVEEYLQKAYKKLVTQVKIPGFRKGKAPRSVLESHVGKDALLDTALEEMLPKVMQDLVEEEKVAVFARPTAELLSKEPVTFKAIIPMPPEVKLGDYNSISLKPKKVTVKKSEVDTVMEQLRAGRATWEPVERAAKFDDLFSTRTGYNALDDRLAKTKAKKDYLLMVLEHPEIPLHNNPAELEARRRVRKRDVSFGPRTDDGRRAWDTFQTLAATTKKLGLSFLDYIHDRVSKANQIPALDCLIAEQAKRLNLGTSWNMS